MGPALGLLELASVAVGIRTGDAMVKRAPVALAYAGTVHPGKYLVLVAGEVADVEEALDAGREAGDPALTDELFLPDVHPQVVAAVRGRRRPAGADGGEALGIVETLTVAALLGAADRGVKSAEVDIQEIRLADGLGGKAYCLFTGEVGDVEEAVERAAAGLPRPDLLVGREVISRLHDEMRANLDAHAELLPRVHSGAGGGGKA
jgi:microcompartment protein CcmL/EutN